ncbi:MAG: ISAs1 family transposase [Candidatus Bathyarchaeota archaeon]|nr:ISAs1 family transposase [Candidatus Termiticorpusculum sp.]
MKYFTKKHKQTLQKLTPTQTPNHQTHLTIIKKYFDNLQKEFNKLLNSGEEEKLLKPLNKDDKTQCGTQTPTQTPNHIVDMINENSFSLCQKLTKNKSKKITAIPNLINRFNIKNYIITTDAMTTQRNIVSLIRKKDGQYALTLKTNHKHFHKAVQTLFSNPQFLTKRAYHKTEEKARGWRLGSIGKAPK